ncbi:MAG TPA: bifunctional DNA-formamidopyrimidine glycosylase/DNA-(apurinic or apyrimidinic site) lyase [Elusimicrobiota bacterium]|nr:bifunctional DNA-formamidopyrimidine glycosylase/DNA-(apurinic or apyrimidinic site) lyase [Elusimicrobiota bacterium]
MPELPEVETVRRALESALLGRVLTAYRVGKPTFYRRPPERVLKVLPGRALDGVRRRGKYLLLDFAGEELSLHLGMSGRIVIVPDGGPDGPHTRLTLSFGERALRFEDARRFGRAGCRLPPLGPEPLDPAFDADALAAALRGRAAPIKALLLDQRVVAGIGNIYATEALFRAGIRPRRASGRLRREEVARLCAAIKEVIAQAVELRGSTLEDESFLDPEGRPGLAQKMLRAYGRETGACGHPLKDARPRIGGRTSLYCPLCQC